MTLPFPVQAYFDADRNNDDEALLHAFTSDAVVEDEGRSHTAHAAIRAWWRETKAKYQTVIEPLEKSEANGVAKIRAKVTGQFPGSPVTLTFMFRLNGNRISHLAIRR